MTIIFNWICPHCKHQHKTEWTMNYCTNCEKFINQVEVNVDTNALIVKLQRRLKHFKKRLKAFQNGETNEELAKHQSFFGGWDIGYYEGRISEIEDTLLELGVNIDE